MDHFGGLLKQANNNMLRHLDQFAQQYDLTGNQMAIIDFITNYANHEVFQRDIEHEFEIQRSTTTVLLQRMEKKALSNATHLQKMLDKKRLFSRIRQLRLLMPVNPIFVKKRKSLSSNFQLKRGRSFSKSYNTIVIFKFIKEE